MQNKGITIVGRRSKRDGIHTDPVYNDVRYINTPTILKMAVKKHNELYPKEKLTNKCAANFYECLVSIITDKVAEKNEIRLRGLCGFTFRKTAGRAYKVLNAERKKFVEARLVPFVTLSQGLRLKFKQMTGIGYEHNYSVKLDQ